MAAAAGMRTPLKRPDMWDMGAGIRTASAEVRPWAATIVIAL
jgi:hypothetical protein